MEKLAVLPDVTRLSATVVRILGQNPGKFTLQGTNTYLVGRRPPFILVDLGEGKEAYTDLLREHLLSFSGSKDAGEAENAAGGGMVSDVIITHEHADHFGGLPSVLSLLEKLSRREGRSHRGPRIHKFPSPSASSSVTDAESRAYDHSIQFRTILDSIPLDLNLFTPTSSDGKVHDLKDDQVLETADHSAQLRVVHTPGHTSDSICLLLSTSSSKSEEPGSNSNPDANAKPKPILFTADSVLGQGTAVFEDLSTYLASLSRLVSSVFLSDDRPESYAALYPGHGPVVEDGPGTIRTYIRHRLEREAQIVQVLSILQSANSELDSKTSGQEKGVKVWDAVKAIYKDYPENLWAPAARGVVLHLKKLEVDGKVRCVDGQGVEQRWFLLAS